jgi:hypothetical protein
MTSIAKPRYATPRTPSRPTRGAEMGIIAETIGVPFLSWQQELSNCALELLPDGTFAYRTVAISMMRQNGKSMWCFTYLMWRCLAFGEPQSTCYSAQSGLAALQRLDEWIALVERSGLADQIEHVRRASGDTSVDWVGGSRIGIIGGLEASGQGANHSAVVIDEAFAPGSAAREYSLRPTLMTQRLGQLIIASNAGTQASESWARWCAQGREAVTSGLTTGLCYLEYSALPGQDLREPGVLESIMPALGEMPGITRANVLHDIAVMEPSQALRSMGNVPTQQEIEMFTRDQIDRVLVDAVTLPAEPAVYALDLDDQRNAGAIVQASAAGNARVVASGLDPDALVAKILAIEKAQFGSQVAIEEKGPLGNRIGEIERAGIRVTRYAQTVSDAAEPPKGKRRLESMTEACSDLADRMTYAGIKVERCDAIVAAFASAEPRKQIDTWTFKRNSTSAPIVALAMALHLAARPPTVWIAS